MNYKSTIFGLACATLFASSAVAEWNPEKPIRIIVPYGAGGVTDQIVRVVAQEMEPVLGQNVVVVNQPGAAGSVGTQAVMNAPKDGYTWLSGGVRDIGTYGVVGTLDTGIEDWHIFTVATISGILSVNKDANVNELSEFVDAVKANPKSMLVATAGINSTGGQALGALATAAEINPEQLVYDGGNPAVMAAASGEAKATTQLSLTQAEMIRAGRLKPLAVFSTSPMVLEGSDPIPSINEFYPKIAPTENFVGIYLPKEVPQDVVEHLSSVWKETLNNSQVLKDLCSSRGCGINLSVTNEAFEASMPLVQAAAWGLFERNEHSVSPADLGIPPIK